MGQETEDESQTAGDRTDEEDVEGTLAVDGGSEGAVGKQGRVYP